MGGTIKKIVKNPIKFVKDTVSGDVKKARTGNSDVQKKVTEEKKKITPNSSIRGVMAGESQAPESRASRRRGRRSNVMTGARGVTGTATTTKKTLLGG